MQRSRLLQDSQKIHYREKLIDSKSRNKRRVLTHHSPASSSFDNSGVTSTHKRAATSDKEYRYSTSFHYHSPSVDKKEETNQANSKGSQLKRAQIKAQKYRKAITSRNGSLRTEQESTDPWGGPSIARGISQKSSSKEQLEKERKSVERLNRLKESIHENQFMASSFIKYRAKNTSKLTKAESLRKRPIADYLQFIFGQGNYSVGFDFSYLRRLSRIEAVSVVDFGNFRVIESIFLCMLDVLKVEDCFADEGCLKMLREYSLLYLRCFEKILVEFVLYFHIFKLSQLKLVSFFVQSRLAILLLHESAAQEPLSNEQNRHLFQLIVQQINQLYKMLNEGTKEIQQEQSYVGEAFKLLKTTAQLQKKSNELVSLIQKAQKIINDKPRVTEIIREFAPLTKEAGLGGLELEYLAQTECFIGWKFYLIPPIPYLPFRDPSKPYTLVLTLTSTLVSYSDETRILQFRPYLDMFLERCSFLFQLVVWADEQKKIADLIIDSIERGRKIFSFRLYQEHLSFKDGIVGRDISRLGRETEKTLLLQCKRISKEDGNVSKNKRERGLLEVNQYGGEPTDSQLLRVLSRLQWMCEGLPADLASRQPLHLDTLEHIEEELQENYTISTHH